MLALNNSVDKPAGEVPAALSARASRIETLETQASLAQVADPTRAPEGMAIGARQIRGTGDEQGSAGAVAGRQPVRAAECARPPEDHNPLIAEEEIVESGIECTGFEAQGAERMSVTRANAWQGMQVRVYSRTANSWCKGTIAEVTNLGVDVHCIAWRTPRRVALFKELKKFVLWCGSAELLKLDRPKKGMRCRP